MAPIDKSSDRRHRSPAPEAPEGGPDGGPATVAEDEFELASGEEASEAVAVPEGRLLSFYDGLRQRLADAADPSGEAPTKLGGKLGRRVGRTLLVVPDVFLLLVRLVLDGETPRQTRALLGGALAYFLLPFDLLPEGFLGPMGFSEDLVLAVAVLASAFDRQVEELARRHWSGSQDLFSTLQDILEGAQALLGKSLYGRLRKLLHGRGIQL